MLLIVESDTYLETRSLALAVTGRTMQSTTRQSTLVTVLTRLNIAIPPYFMTFLSKRTSVTRSGTGRKLKVTHSLEAWTIGCLGLGQELIRSRRTLFSDGEDQEE